MPSTSPPTYTDVVSRPVWTNGKGRTMYGQVRVVPGKDIILAEDINNLREAIDIMFNHVHDYTDSIGSC